jgi:hypothetical protein
MVRTNASAFGALFPNRCCLLVGHIVKYRLRLKGMILAPNRPFDVKENALKRLDSKKHVPAVKKEDQNALVVNVDHISGANVNGLRIAIGRS